MSAKAILQLIPIMQSETIAGENIKLLNKKNKTSKDFIGTGVKNIIGIELTKLTANEIEGF